MSYNKRSCNNCIFYSAVYDDLARLHDDIAGDIHHCTIKDGDVIPKAIWAAKAQCSDRIKESDLDGLQS